MIELKKINKVYDDGFQALKDIDLTFEEGKINVLIGPSGCGKTTTMKLLNRLTEHTDGQILIDGKDIKEINPIELRRRMGYVIQSIGLFPHMTIYDNVATVPKLLKWEKQKIKQRVEELLNMVSLPPETYMKRYPSELSGGQQQRIGVIRALAAEPSTILMDEPFSALDPISREQLQDELVRLQKEIKKTIVFVTHDMDEAIKIADQIILMKDGHVVQKGSPQELLSNPANDFVKEFIGEERLGNNQSLPPLNKLIVKDYPSIPSTLSVEEAVNKMVSNHVAGLPVVDAEGAYLGVISLYKALDHKKASLVDLVDNTVMTVQETTDSNELLSKISGEKSIIPLLSEENKLIGVVDNKKLLEALHQIYKSKSGVA
ncbi:osmoprotectant transport system ATP-binding protein [Salirhabdus euzebyi]|uniref:Quaternary amine transport ATP-binding protein n=1 Tax=Salirhabdus euzebyi TaxID=394506 RepID=A0A841Q6B9_9BACI|nr:betaine/proline/choline family ABC transporter ATP-binding protein [Salirhabdus euzebyi]MBB6453948.1 osmoprotectant transport system ATP-binding protein [Salirhabdus euzebyi]